MTSLPVAVVGAGPVGLAAAAHMLRRDQPFVVLESGAAPAAAVREWSHVRTFSPWRYMIDGAARSLLEATGWTAPDAERIPTGGELVAQYLQPLASHPAIHPHITYGARVVAIGRKDFDKVRTNGRDQQPFALRLEHGETIDARAVIDASGTWRQPNPAGSGGVPANGELGHTRIAYGIPDVLGKNRAEYEGKRTLVVGSGHSAFTVILDLLDLLDLSSDDKSAGGKSAVSNLSSGDKIIWAMRKERLDSLWGGGSADGLEARGELGQRARRAVESGRIRVVTPFRIRSFEDRGDAVRVIGRVRDHDYSIDVDRVIACTGFRPDLAMLSEVRLGLDSWLESPSALAPLIDPNEHSCGTVRPHGARELAHPEKDFYIVGMKSYGRAPTFLLATGYEQVRSVAAMLAGDVAAAERVELVLPATGVCDASAPAGTGCCAPAPQPLVLHRLT